MASGGYPVQQPAVQLVDDRADVKETFRKADLNGDGKISKDECVSIFRDIFPAWSEEDFNDLFGAADVNSDGYLNYDEFVDWLYSDPPDDAGPKMVLATQVLLRSTYKEGDPGGFIHPQTRSDSQEAFKVRIAEFEKEDVQVGGDERICIQSPFSNLAGVYAVTAEKEGRSVFLQEGAATYLVFVDGCWRLTGDEEGMGRFPECECNDEASHPADAAGGWTKGLTGVKRLQKVNAVSVASSPQRLGMTSREATTGIECSNLCMGLRRADDYQDYPCYSSENGNFCLYHDQGAGQWILGGGGPGSGSYYDKLQCNVVNPINLCGEWDHAGNIVTIYEVNWPEDVGASDGLYEDEDFPAETSSLGEGRECEWVRASQLVRGTEVKLFDTIEPLDLMQGSLGDCWLIAALSCAAEFPRRIEELFPNGSDIAPDGRYPIRLWNLRTEEFEEVVIDDRIPCKPFQWWQKTAETIYAKPKGAEIWCVLLEKAFAKLHTSYKKMDGGNCAWAWQAITGCSDCLMLEKTDSGWQQYNLSLEGQKSQAESGNYGAHTCPFTSRSPPPTVCKTLQSLASWLNSMDKKQYIMGASIKGSEGEKKRDDGLVENHAYSIIKILRKLPGGMEPLVQLRNPWGKEKEWLGPWSDRSSEWDTYPEVKEMAGFRPGDNGRFWMPISDFQRIYSSMTVCRVKDAEVSGPLGEQWFREPGEILDDILDDDGNISAIKLWSSDAFIGGMCRFFKSKRMYDPENEAVKKTYDADALIARCSNDKWFAARLRDVARGLGDCADFVAELENAINGDGSTIANWGLKAEAFHNSIGIDDPKYGFQWWMGAGGAESMLQSAFGAEYINDGPSYFAQDLTELYLSQDDFESAITSGDAYWLQFMLTN